jgi:hypothetical protein
MCRLRPVPDLGLLRAPSGNANGLRPAIEDAVGPGLPSRCSDNADRRGACVTYRFERVAGWELVAVSGVGGPTASP